MRIITFPGGDAAGPDDAWVIELESALSGGSEGPAAESWRQLRDDVRSLASPMAPGFELRLTEQLERPRTRAVRRGLLGRMSAVWRPRAVAGLVSAVVAGVIALVLVLNGPQGSTPQPRGVASRAPAAAAGEATAGKAQSSLATSGAAVPAAHARTRETLAKANAPAFAQAGGGSAGAGARVQQLAASLTLSTHPGNVQSVSEAIARLAVREEGYVQQSHVQVQQHGSSEASLLLKLPSARLSAALAAIARLAPSSSESQSLQDITNAYDAARQRLDDANAERQALLRALDAATTEGQIDSLRERLAQARSAITRDQAALQTVSARASTAELEVTVLAGAGGAAAAGEGLTLHRGLHDALRVLTVALAATLIGAAALVPLALLIAALAGAHGVWRRYRRERALDAA